MRIYYWIHHTGGNIGNTGVQRVVRNLAGSLAALDLDLVPVRWCSEREAIVRAERRFAEGLAQFGGPNLQVGPEEEEPIHLAAADRSRLAGAWLLLPEVPHLAGPGHPNLPAVLDYARYYGLRSAAIFYDLIPLLQPGYEALAEDHARYARALAGVDLVLPISRYAGETLRQWWQGVGYEAARLPRLKAQPLPEEIVGVPRVTAPDEVPDKPVRFVACGTLEPRKNQIQAMRAFARLCASRPDLDLTFDLVGGLHSDIAETAQSIARTSPRIRLHGNQPDAQVQSLVRASHATVFLSLEEGYGQPVAESLWQGKPCLSSNHGAVAEIAVGGGCLMVDATDPTAIEAGFRQLAEDRALRRILAEQAYERRFLTWREYGQEIAAALAGMPAIERIVVIESLAHGADELATALANAGASVRRLHWRPDLRVVLPGGPRTALQPAPGDGQLQGCWSIIPGGLTAEAGDIIAAAHSLGLRVALEVTQDTPLCLLGVAELSLFADAAARDATLVAALRELPRTVGLRQRLQLGIGPAALTAIAAARARLTEAGPPQRPKRLLYWIGLTVSQPFNTGVQRVARLLANRLQQLGVELVPVKWDEDAGAMAPISAEEAVHFARWGGPRPHTATTLPEDLAGEWMLLPEITLPLVPPGSNVVRLAHSRGMRIAAIFYDLIPAKMPQYYPPNVLDLLRGYWRSLAEADLVLPISWTMASEFGAWLKDQQLAAPLMVPCTLAGEGSGIERDRARPAATEDLRLLAIGTWEPRKNYLRLLRALSQAQARAQRPIRLTIVGRRAGFTELDSQIEQLATAAGVETHDHVSDETLLALHKAATATVFASWEEGFGLPVLESLWRGLPCLCHSGSAMAEVAPGGGVLQVDMQDEAAITNGLLRLAEEPGLIARLTAEAAVRPIRSWDEYAEDVLLALGRAGGSRGWPLPAIARRRPLLSCAIATGNRAASLRRSLPRVLESTRPWRDLVEVVVCDDASIDDTAAIVTRLAGERNLATHRNPNALGMPGNLRAAAQHARGAFIWLLTDCCLLTDGAMENVLEGLATYPDIETAYLNYSIGHSPAPDEPAAEVIAMATPAVQAGPNRRVSALREVVGLHAGLFASAPTCVFRRDHALRAYDQDLGDGPRAALPGWAPASVYAFAVLLERPAWWVGAPALVTHMDFLPARCGRA